MKSFQILALTALANAAVLQKRQYAEMLIDYALGNPMEPILRKELQPELDPKAKRELLVWGPFKLIAANGTHPPPSLLSNKFDPNSDTILNSVNGVCKDCLVLRANQLTSDKEGKWQGVEQGVYTHHFVSVISGKAQPMNAVIPKCWGMDLPTMLDPYLPAGGQPAPGVVNGAAIFIGKGNDDVPMTFASKDPKVKSGYYMNTDGRMVLSAELNNYKPYDRDIYVSMDYEYIKSPVPGQRPPGYLDVSFGSMGVECNLVGTMAPPGDKPYTYTSPEWVVHANGYFVNWLPHLHDGGVDIKILVNGKDACTTKAIYGGSHGSVGAHGAPSGNSTQQWETITGYTSCDEAIKVKKNDVITMTSLYDLQKHPLRPNAAEHSMGMAGGMGAEGMALANFFFAPAEDQTASF